MTEQELCDTFRDNDGIGFNRIDRDKGIRTDLRAFNLIDRLVQSDQDIVAAAEHDQIWIGVSLEELAATSITKEDVVDLVRWGVMLDEETESLSMFV